jgi:hypothetical protein
MSNLGGPREGNCTFISFTVIEDSEYDFRTCDHTDPVTVPWASLLTELELAGATRLTFDLFDVAQPSGRTRRYRVVNEGMKP